MNDFKDNFKFIQQEQIGRCYVMSAYDIKLKEWIAFRKNIPFVIVNDSSFDEEELLGTCFREGQSREESVNRVMESF